MLIPGQTAFLEALGWALLNSLWQFGLLSLLFILLLSASRNLTSPIKHGLALFLLTAGCTGFTINLSYFFLANGTGQLIEPFVEPKSYSIPYTAIRYYLENCLPYLSAVYLLIVTAMFFNFFRYFYHSHKILKRGLVELPATVGLHVQKLVEQLGIQRTVRIWASELVDSPMIIGFVRPTILIPVACINQLQVTQLEAILLHELAHIRRNDYLVNLFLAACDIVFFFNPFARFLVNIIKSEREHCCDDKVLELHENPHQYATALLALEQSRSGYFSIGLAATGKSRYMLLHRIQRILKVKAGSRVDYRGQFLYSFFAVGIICFLACVVPEVKPIKTASEKIISYEIKKVQVIVEAKGAMEAPTVVVNKTVFSRETRQKVKVNSTSIQASDEAGSYFIPVVANSLDNDSESINLMPAVNEEKRDFSIPAQKEPVLPLTVLMPNDFPFVPHSSFSFYRMQDTSKPGYKHKNLQERKAHEAAMKAKLALDKINWEKIQFSLKSEIDVALIRQQIQSTLEQINWEEINRVVQDSLRLESMQNMEIELERANQLKMEQHELLHEQEKLRRDIEKKIKRRVEIIHI